MSEQASNMDSNTVPPVGVFVIILFLLIGLIVMGCMLYWNWSHRKQRHAEDGDNISNGNACIYEKNNQRAYNRSSNGPFLFAQNITLFVLLSCYSHSIDVVVVFHLFFCSSFITFHNNILQSKKKVFLI